MKDVSKWHLTATQIHVHVIGDNGGTEMLFNVMKAYAVCDPEVGYCQGSAFLAGMLLLHMPEEDAFSVFMKLMSKGSGKILYNCSGSNILNISCRLWTSRYV